MKWGVGWLAVLGSGALACGDDGAPAEPWTTTTQAADDTDGEASTADDADDTTTADTGEIDTATTAADDTDGSSTTTAGTDCTLPDPVPPWLAGDLEDTVARLSGAVEIAPGITLSDRASATRRAQTADWLQGRLDALGLVGERHEYGTGTNVFAIVPATQQSEGTLVFGAHYDSVPGSPGANDNATGVAVALALARQLQDVPCRSHDVIVVLFDEEEIGLVGSAAFAQALVDSDEPVVSVHTIDQQGWDADGDRRIEIERPDAGLLDVYEEAAAELVAPMELVPTDTGATDHVSFRAVGFAAVGITEEYVSGDTTPYYHGPGDVFATVDLDYLRSGSALVNHAFARSLSGS